MKPDEAYRLATYGLHKLREQSENASKPKNDEPVEEDTDTKLSRVERELNELRNEKTRDNEINSINRTLHEAAQQSEVTKTNPKIAAKINAISLARININPRLNLQQVYKEELADYLDMVKGSIEQERNANGKVNGKIKE
mgnify:CR=1 FL=1